MTKKTKAISLALSAAVALSSFGMFVSAEGTAYEKVVDLKVADTVFNHVVATGAPDDVEVYYSDDDGTTWLNMDLSKQEGATGTSGLINNGGVIGYLYGGYGDNAICGTSNTTNCTYASYTADKIKLVSATESLDNVSVRVYNAEDIAPTANEIKSDNSLFNAVAGDGVTALYTERIFDGNRLNNVTNSNPAYIYNVDTSKAEITDNDTAEVVINLGSTERKISKIGLGNIFNGLGKATGGLGNRYTISYYDSNNNEWVQIADVDNTVNGAGRQDHATVNVTDSNATTNKIKIVFTFNPNVKNTVSGTSIVCVWLSYVGIYDFGNNLAEADQFSAAVDLGKDITFNTLTSAETVDWQYSLDGAVWTEYTEGTDMTARYIRAASDEGIEEAPAFDLFWSGNLAKYAGEGYNGASITGASHNNAAFSVLYDGVGKVEYTNAESVEENVAIYANYSKHNFRFSMNASAYIESVQCYWVSNGVMYPHTYKIETSNKETIWNTADLTITEKYEANKKVYTNGAQAVGITAAVVNVDYTKSYREYDGRTNYLIRTTEIEIPGTVSLAQWDCSSVTYPEIGDDEAQTTPEPDVTPEPTVEPTPEPTEEPTPVPATYVNTFVANITPETDASITKGTSATAVLSEITPNDQTIKSVTWTISEKTGTYTADDGAEISGAGTVKFGLILDWGTTGLPTAFTGLSEGAVITSITTVIK